MHLWNRIQSKSMLYIKPILCICVVFLSIWLFATRMIAIQNNDDSTQWASTNRFIILDYSAIQVTDQTRLADVYDYFALHQSLAVLYISYDMSFIVPNSDIAKNLYHIHRTLQHRWWQWWPIYSITARQRNDFRYQDWSSLLLIPWSVISRQANHRLHNYSWDIPRYMFSHMPRDRLAQLPIPHDIHTSKNYTSQSTSLFSPSLLLSQQQKNFSRYFVTRLWRSRWWISINPWDWKIYWWSGVAIRNLFRSSYNTVVSSMLSLYYVDTLWHKDKIIRDRLLSTYVHPENWSEVLVASWWQLLQAIPDWYWDIDSIQSHPVERIGNVTACVRSYRYNMWYFDLRIPFWPSANAIAQQSHAYRYFVWLQPSVYLWESRFPVWTVDDFLQSHDNRFDLLDPKTFPKTTNIVGIYRHSTTPAGRLYGHSSMWFVHDGRLWILDPYTDVPWYAPRDPKLFDDFIVSTKAKHWLALSKLYYYSVPYIFTTVW